MPHQCTACNRVFADGSKEMLSGCPDCGGNKFQFQPAGRDIDDQPPSPTPTGSGESTDRSSTQQNRSKTHAESTSSTSEFGTPATESSSTTADGTVSTKTESTGSTNGGPLDADETPSSDPSTRTTTPADQLDETDAVSDTSDMDGTERVADRDPEDMAQATARSDVVSSDELAQASRDTVSSRSGPNVSPTRGGTPTTVNQETPANREDRPDIDDLRAELNDQFESIRIVSPGQYELNLMELYDRQEYIISLQEDGRYVIEMPDGWGIDDE